MTPRSHRRLLLTIFPIMLVGVIGLMVYRRSPQEPFHQREARQDQAGSAPSALGTGPSSLPPTLATPNSPNSDTDGSTRSYVKSVLEELLSKYRGKLAKAPAHDSGRFVDEAATHFREGRLLTLAYPEYMEGLLISRAKDPTLDSESRAYCAALLGLLSKAGRKDAREALIELVKGSDKRVSQAALSELSKTDLKGQYLDLYLGKCRENELVAFEAVPFWIDASVIREMEIIVAKSPGNSYPQCEIRGNAEEALAKIRMLQAPDCDQKLEAILDGSSTKKDWFPWAVKAAAMRSLTGTLGALGRHLDRVEKSHENPASEEQRALAERLKEIGADRANALAQGRSPGPYHLNYDDALVAYSELGGELNEIQKRRLYIFGYACNPKQRLEELLSTGK